eukprot:3933279-Rhodomonas_salina.3
MSGYRTSRMARAHHPLYQYRTPHIETQTHATHRHTSQIVMNRRTNAQTHKALRHSDTPKVRSTRHTRHTEKEDAQETQDTETQSAQVVA